MITSAPLINYISQKSLLFDFSENITSRNFYHICKCKKLEENQILFLQLSPSIKPIFLDFRANKYQTSKLINDKNSRN